MAHHKVRHEVLTLKFRNSALKEYRCYVLLKDRSACRQGLTAVESQKQESSSEVGSLFPQHVELSRRPRGNRC
jgi:hypothetical protein